MVHARPGELRDLFVRFPARVLHASGPVFFCKYDYVTDASRPLPQLARSSDGRNLPMLERVRAVLKAKIDNFIRTPQTEPRAERCTPPVLFVLGIVCFLVRTHARKHTRTRTRQSRVCVGLCL